jgi:hypothetical protein
MRHIRIITGILDDAGLGEILRPELSRASAKDGVSPFGNVMETGSGKRPVSSAVSAALVAAVAQAPVVQPRLSGPEGLRLSRDFGFARDHAAL